MPRKPVARNSPPAPKAELFAADEVESVVPELSAIQRAQGVKPVAAAGKKPKTGPEVQPYRHPEATTLLRPEVGTQDRFRNKKAPQAYSYDPSLSPQLMWAGKAERLSFNVPTLPLFIHERLSTKAILETLKGHRRSDEEQLSLVENLFGDPRHSEADQLLKAYAHSDRWVNRMILGDALVAMNSLLRYESLGGQVQMIYIDPPYGVKFGSNFQPFVRKRDVAHGDDEDLTREPEMVQAYRDTWELGLHSYLTYLRDRLLLSRELLHQSGSIFIQISDANLHHVRELMDEVFGAQNFVSVISYVTTNGIPGNQLSRAGDYLIWYAKDIDRLKYRQLFGEKALGNDSAAEYRWALLVDGTSRALSDEEFSGRISLPLGARVFRFGPLTSPGYSEKGSLPFEYEGVAYSPGPNNHWKVSREGLQTLSAAMSRTKRKTTNLAKTKKPMNSTRRQPSGSTVSTESRSCAV